MNIAVIGANGFLGRNICKKYLELGYTVFAYQNKNIYNIPFGCKLITKSELSNIKFEYLFISIGNYSVETAGFLEQINLVLELIKTIIFRKVIFISSTAVYGNHLTKININSCFDNPTKYGLSKIAQEFIISTCVNYAIIRPTYIYGNEMNKNSLIPMWIENALKKGKIIVYGNGHRTQDYIHINDLIELCTRVADHNENSIVLAATGQSISNKVLATIIRDCYPQTIIEFQGEDNGYSFEFEISETIDKFKWSPSSSIETWINSLAK